MLFTIDKAFEIKKHYADILIGSSMTPNSESLVSGLFVCHQGNAPKVCGMLVDANFDERGMLIADNDKNEVKYEVYVYHYDGANVAYHELDKNLTQRGMAKVY